MSEARLKKPRLGNGQPVQRPLQQQLVPSHHDGQCDMQSLQLASSQQASGFNNQVVNHIQHRLIHEHRHMQCSLQHPSPQPRLHRGQQQPVFNQLRLIQSQFHTMPQHSTACNVPNNQHLAAPDLCRASHPERPGNTPSSTSCKASSTTCRTTMQRSLHGDAFLSWKFYKSLDEPLVDHLRDKNAQNPGMGKLAFQQADTSSQQAEQILHDVQFYEDWFTHIKLPKGEKVQSNSKKDVSVTPIGHGNKKTAKMGSCYQTTQKDKNVNNILESHLEELGVQNQRKSKTEEGWFEKNAIQEKSSENRKGLDLLNQTSSIKHGKQTRLLESLEKEDVIEKEHDNMDGQTTNTSEEQASDCAICFENFDDYHRALFIPCGHANVCMKCAKVAWSKRKVCPICLVKVDRRPILLPRKLYM